MPEYSRVGILLRGSSVRVCLVVLNQECCSSSQNNIPDRMLRLDANKIIIIIFLYVLFCYYSSFSFICNVKISLILLLPSSSLSIFNLFFFSLFSLYYYFYYHYRYYYGFVFFFSLLIKQLFFLHETIRLVDYFVHLFFCLFVLFLELNL